MNFSTTYPIYLPNRQLEKAIEHYMWRVSDELASAALPDSDVTVVDNFTYTRGDFEQQRYSSNVFAPAIEFFEAASQGDLKSSAPADWVALQNSLGNVLAAKGQQQRDEAFYRQAISAFDNALSELSQEAFPAEWATTLYNLGTASKALGVLLEDQKLFKAAADAYTKALLVWSREDAPEEWMYTMHQLGSAFHLFGKHLKGNRTFQKSVVAYKNALAVLDADNYALALTATHNNRGTVLHHLGESEENPDRLEEAINSYDKALTVSMEQQLPFHLSVICRVNKTTAQNVLADQTGDAALAGEVADEFELMLECFRHALQPLCAKHCEAQLAKAKALQ
jgi:tetratricopeptide (TPR) repeat protein